MTMPYWTERLRVRMIHELGGYTAEDVDAEVDVALRYDKQSRKADFVEICGVAALDGIYDTLDPLRIIHAKNAALEGIAKELRDSKAVHYRIIPWEDKNQALLARCLCAVPNNTEGVDNDEVEAIINDLNTKRILEEMKRYQNEKR